MKQSSKALLLGLGVFLLALSSFFAVKQLPAFKQKPKTAHLIIDSLVHQLVCRGHEEVYRKYRKTDRAEDFCLIAPRKAYCGENNGKKGRVGRQRNDPPGQPACGDFQP